MKRPPSSLLSLLALAPLAACGGSDPGPVLSSDPSQAHAHGDGHEHGPDEDHAHAEDDGHGYEGEDAHSHDPDDDHGHSGEDTHSHGPGDAHAHDEQVGDEHAEVPLGTTAIGPLEVTLAQGHGGLAPGKEAHLVVKLPYSDGGSTTVRAWIGTEDRTLSFVGKGAYDSSHGDYDIHATAPKPLPANAMWWIEIQQPDGTRLVGSAEPLLE